MKRSLPTVTLMTKIRCRLLSDAGLVKLAETMTKKIKDLAMNEYFCEGSVVKGIRLIVNASFVIGFLDGRTGVSNEEPAMNLYDAWKRFEKRWMEFDPSVN